MSSKFCEYIVSTLLTYFQNRVDAISPGSRYCLRLDTSELVQEVYDCLSSVLEKKKIKGHFNYKGVYQTYTLHLEANKELVVAAKLENITDDFFTSLRNNDLTENRYPILIITHSTIDSIESGTADMSAKGMPFHSKSLIDSLSKDIESQFHSHPYDETLLNIELEERSKDRFSEKSSLSVYSDIIGVVNKPNLDFEDYYALGYFPDRDAYKYKETLMKKNLTNNRECFKQIDSVAKFGNINQLKDQYRSPFVQKLQKNIDTGNDWYKGLTYRDVQKALIVKNDSLVVVPEDIKVFSEIKNKTFDRDKDFFVRADGTTKALLRKLNVLIFNPDAEPELSIEVSLGGKVALKDSDVTRYGLDLEVNRDVIKAKIKSNGINYGKIVINKSEKIKSSFEIRIAVLNIAKKILENIRTTFSIGIRGSKVDDAKLKLTELSESLTFNSSASIVNSEPLEDGKSYQVNDSQGLQLLIKDSSFDPDDDSANFELRIGSLSLPVLLKRTVRPGVLTGKKAFLLKYSKQRSIEYASDRLISETDTYIPYESFKKRLEIEDFIVKNGCFSVKKGLNGLEDNKLELPENIKQPYLNFINELRNASTLPSLAYYKDTLKDAAEAYVDAVYSTLEQIEEGHPLSDELNNLLCIGSVVTRQCLSFSPLHPLNVAYQLELMKEEGFGELSEYLVKKLSAINLLPYARSFEGERCQPVYHSDLPEWVDYIPASKTGSQGGKSFVPSLVKEKINQYLKHFQFLFEGVDNPLIKLNLVGLGDCADILEGITDYYYSKIKEGKSAEDLKSFEIHIYEKESGLNQFSILSSPRRLKAYVKSHVSKPELRNEIYSTLASHIHCFYHLLEDKQYAYAHITFYEMPDSDQNSDSLMDNINTGISLNGLVSGIPSVLDQAWHKTGFGTKYANENKLVKFAKLLNAAQRVAFSGRAYSSDEALFTEISQNNQDNLDKMYQTSNWVVFISPKVDLSYFYSGKSKDLMIIHYSDQYTSTSGYDDITVTNKSGQYKEIIKEQISQKGIQQVDDEKVSQLIKFFSSINGQWLLRLIASKNPNYSREKMSILSAVKVLMNYFAHPDILWVPISLEELLRVSGGAGYSSSEGLLSARNLGFSQGPVCDDILMVGLYAHEDSVKLYLHPVEVKIGNNYDGVLSKAEKQAFSTYKGLKDALNPTEKTKFLGHKMLRNFVAQQLIVCCEKFKLYSPFPGKSWEKVLDTYRRQLLNDEYEISTSLEPLIGKATVVSFKSDVQKITYSDEDDLKQITLPEGLGSEILTKEDSEIKTSLEEGDGSFVFPLANCTLNELPEVVNNDLEIDQSDYDFEEDTPQEPDQESEEWMDENGEENDNAEKVPEGKEEGEEAAENEKPSEVVSSTPRSMRIRFGTDIATGNPVDWYPNDTEMVFHTNTGIIGTMGTGKTQFTKSLVSQLIDNQADNFTGDPLGILIFDYKGDYNEGKKDFFNATKAKIFKPYHLPFNPLSLIRGKQEKKLLPRHVGNAFVTTLAKIYNLGAKQTNALGQCIAEAYELKGISPGNSSTWDREAPTFNTVYDCYINNQEIKKNDSLASAMTKLFDFEIFEPDPKQTKSLFEVLNGVVVIDLSGYDTDIQNLIVAITLDLFYAQMFTEGSSKLDNRYRQLTRMILVDEADNFMSEGFPSLKKIMKEGREFGVGVILSTQFLKHFGTTEDDYSSYILTWVVHGVADLKGRDVDFIFKTEAKSQESARLFNDVKALTKHHSIVKIGNNKPQYMKDFAFWEYLKEGAEKSDSTKD